jgi:CHAT domain-containing protein
LPPGQAIVFYSILPQRLAVWVMSRSRLDAVIAPVGAARLADEISGFRTAILSGRRAASRELSSALYGQIIEPVEPLLAPDAAIAFVADGPLNDLPFSALRHGPSGPFLIEQHALSLLPNLSAVVTAAGASRHERPMSVLAVGAPDLRDGPFKALPPLPAAASEARQIADLYPKSEVLEGRQATRPAFLEGIVDADVVHFGGHAVSVPEFPRLSQLVLADSPNAANTVDTRALGALKLVRAPVVVLAACSTASGPLFRGEGPLSLARPFLAAGARAVVATMWDIDDAASAAVFIALHRALASGATAARALQAAQRAAIHAEEPGSGIAGWAGVMSYGLD